MEKNLDVTDDDGSSRLEKHTEERDAARYNTGTRMCPHMNPTTAVDSAPVIGHLQNAVPSTSSHISSATSFAVRQIHHTALPAGFYMLECAPDTEIANGCVSTFKRHRLEIGQNVIGSDPSHGVNQNPIVINRVGMSKTQCVIEISADSLIISDLKSEGGTSVRQSNGKFVQLKPGEPYRMLKQDVFLSIGSCLVFLTSE
jgi:hypothetical protein